MRANSWTYRVGIFAVVLLLALATSAPLAAQRGGPPRDPNLPEEPTAVAIPTISAKVTGPGTMYQSVQSWPPGKDLPHFNYVEEEYLVTGTARGEPYKTRIVVRKPADDAQFSGFVMMEAMHPSGHTPIFEYTSNYFMDSGHIDVEVVTGGLNFLTEHNPARYEGIQVSNSQVSEILAQIGAAIKSDHATSPIAGLGLRNMVLAGTSATAGILVRYLPGHMVYRTPDMERIFDGFLPHANGSTIQRVDVPLIQVPTMTEVMRGAATPRQDGDEPGNQYRLYEFAGMAHVDSRQSIRFQPHPCAMPMSQFPLQAYVSVALHHLLRWVDEGITPPRADRVLVDRNPTNDGSLMALDALGNPIGGIRNPYVDAPTAKHIFPNALAEPEIPNAHPAAGTMCRLGSGQEVFSAAKLRELYGDKQTYLNRVESQVRGLEAAGWSLPVYREMIMADADKVHF
ncbi:MAG: alpha/beta hydrolase domain-containing protein [Proteobacteria bacterium]|nr:alpha/beta hydrolase domain-containing protein [Pseudomonadota bacterium]